MQRDLLPIIEGSSVTTKHGNVSTDHILFICSGAFHSVKPSDMLAELQGRLPIRVELKGLVAEDFVRILTEPEYNMVKQQQVGAVRRQCYSQTTGSNIIAGQSTEVERTQVVSGDQDTDSTCMCKMGSCPAAAESTSHTFSCCSKFQPRESNNHVAAHPGWCR